MTHSHLEIPRFTIGMGDRFAHEGEAQLGAVMEAFTRGIPIAPVWNKSNREHTIIGSEPGSVRAEADAAVGALNWNEPYFVDADHIGLATVDRFLEASDFFTVDVADFTGKPASADSIAEFVRKHESLIGDLTVEGIGRPLVITREFISATAAKFLLAMQEAGKIYRHIAERKARFVTEVSVDETDTPQGPAELLLILAMLADEGVPAQTIAPKFTGRFNKGVDYVGDLARFGSEFEEDLCVIRHAVRTFGLPKTLKLSVHSGSDKFALYPIINRLIAKHGAGLHLKTAGTTWLEEVIGLAESGGEGLEMAQEIYAGAYAKFEDLAKPYATVIDIDPAKLPSPPEVKDWSSGQYTAALRHDQQCHGYNPHFRQLIHVAFKVAAGMEGRFLGALEQHREIIARNVRENLLLRHILPVFGGPEK